ncbi:MAG: hypothetical protein NY202_01490 [Mollicutes bacterium UO1]
MPTINHFFAEIQVVNFFQSKIYRASLSTKKEAQKPVTGGTTPGFPSKVSLAIALSLSAFSQPSPILLGFPQFTPASCIMTML